MEIKETMKLPGAGNIKLPKIKGRVNIQLFNEKTGALEAETHGENMATDAIQKIFGDNIFGLVNYYELLPIKDVLLGGVLCFRDPLTEDAGNIYPPTTNVNPVTAHAGQTTYDQAGDDNTRGNPNNIESGAVSGGFKHVWDFASTQGNGLISALALTNSDCGDYWLNNGNKLAPVHLFGRSNLVGGSVNDNNYVMPLFYDETNNCAYALFGASTGLTIRKYKDYSALNAVGINETILSYNGPIEATAHVYEDHNLTLANNIFGYRYLFLEADQEIHALYYGNGSIVRHIIDLSDFTMTRSDMTVSGANMTTSYNTTYPCCRAAYLDDNGFLYAPKSGGNTMYKIEYSNPSNVTELTGTATVNTQAEIITFGGFAYNPFGGTIADGTRVVQVNRPEPMAASASVHNYEPFTKPTNGLTTMNDFLNNSEHTGLYAGFWKLFLATIFNLETPITKTSTQTMKVTYTITAEAEP